jgi:Protein of unknown function (DUF732)
MNEKHLLDERRVNRGIDVMRSILLGAAGAAMAIGLATPAGASPAPHPAAAPEFLAAARAAGVTGTDPAMLADGYDVCWQLWNAHAEGTAVAAGLVRDHPGVSSDEAAHFVLAAYHNLCPVPGAYDYWAYSTS